VSELTGCGVSGLRWPSWGCTPSSTQDAVVHNERLRVVEGTADDALQKTDNASNVL
jgi:hypothetical protein